MPNQSSKFRKQNWVQINNDFQRVYNINSQIKFKTSRIQSSLCEYSDAYILVIRNITNAREIAAANNRKT